MRRCVAALRHTRVNDGFPNVAISLMTLSARGGRIDMAAAALNGVGLILIDRDHRRPDPLDMPVRVGDVVPAPMATSLGKRLYAARCVAVDCQR